MSYRRLFVLCLLLNLLASCRPSVSPTAVPPDASTVTPALLPSPTPESSPTTPPEPTMTAVPTMEPTPTSPPQLAPAPADWFGLADWLKEAWAGPFDAAEVRAALQAVGRQTSDSDWRSSDLTGDLQDEWILTLYTLPGDPEAIESLRWQQGDFWIVNGEGVIYRASDDAFEATSMAPVLAQVGDMTGDGISDVVTETSFCGAHTCYQDYRILSSHAAPLRNVIVGEDGGQGTANMAYAESRFTDLTEDGLPDLVLHGGIIGSAGAGIQRAYTEIWSWNGTAVTLWNRRFDPSDYRFHWLYDANDAFAAGDYETARSHYVEVVENESLVDVEWVEAAPEIRAATQQFAAFRLALLALQAENESEATVWRDWLVDNYPDAPLTEGANILVESFAQQGDLVAACSAVTNYLMPLERPTGPLTYMGYGNPELTAEDVCPLPEQAG